jgi:two-component system phosphate regulon sensor histidine kinase PhoR
VQVNSCLQTDSLPNLLHAAFAAYGTAGDYDVAVNDCSDDEMLMGYNFKNYAAGVKVPTAAANKQEEPCYYLNVTFNEKPKTLMQEMWFWLFASVCCLLVFVFFGYSLYVLLKEKRLAEMKKDFINNMTHELKTPIANIAVASDMLKAFTKPEPESGQSNMSHRLSAEKVQTYAGIIQKENERLRSQVERVLTVAFMEECSLDLKLEPLDMNDLLAEIIAHFSLRIQQRQGNILFVTKATEAFVQADKFHLTNVIYSLLDNADKYSPDRPIISLSTETTAKGLRMTIADEGIGIDATAKRYVFDKFYRVPTGDVHDVKGFGLGLAYAKMVVEAHHGSIGLDSTRGGGSRFYIDLPQPS